MVELLNGPIYPPSAGIDLDRVVRECVSVCVDAVLLYPADLLCSSLPRHLPPRSLRPHHLADLRDTGGPSPEGGAPRGLSEGRAFSV